MGTGVFYAHSTECSDARDWQGLADHLQAVADLAAKRAARFGWENAGRAAGLLHDLGKYSPAFQRRLSGSGERVDHSTAGALEAKTRFPDGLGHLLAYAIAGHHAGLANTMTALYKKLVTRRAPARAARIEACHATFASMLHETRLLA